MALSNGTPATQGNGHKPKTQRILPALPLIPTKKPVQPATGSQVAVAVAESSASIITNNNGKSSALNGSHSPKRLQTADESLNGHLESSAPLTLVLDEIASVQSSLEPSSTTDNDSNVSSAITSEFVDNTVLASQPTPLDTIGVSKPDSNNRLPEKSETTPNGVVAVTEVQNGGDAERKTPEHILTDPVVLMPEISPLTNITRDNHPAELSASSTAFSATSVNSSFIQPTNKPFQLRDTPGEQVHSYPEVLNNGHAPSASLSRRSNHSDAVGVAKPLPTILEHLLYLNNSKQLADWTIQVGQPGANIQSFFTYAHSFVLSRTEQMRKAMAHQSNPTFNLPLIQLNPARSVQPHAFEAALRFFYSDTVLSPESLFPRDTYMDRHARAHVVDYVLSYWVSGIELGLLPVSSRAHALLAGMMDWDIAEFLVREVYSLRMASSLVSNHQTSAEISLMAESILRLVFGLFIHRFDPEHFKLDVDGHCGVMPSRFATFDHGKPNANPVLAGMVFGSMPSTANMSPASSNEEKISSADAIASVIMLNLDFPDLSSLAGEILRKYNRYGASVLLEVISEREKRRLNIWNDKSISNRERVAASTSWDIIGWREEFQSGELHRERVGYLLPGKKSKTHLEIES